MKLLFVHIPKTGGTSIKNLINDDWNRKWPMGHDPYFELQKMNLIDDSIFKFSVVRNPYTRAFSYYKHYLVQNNSNKSFEDFLNMIRIKQGTVYTPMIIYNQSFYVYDLNGQCSLSKIYYFEKLTDLEKDLNVNLPVLRKGNYNKTEFLNSYNQKTINLVKHIYLEDFINFDYSFDFKDAIT